MSSPCYDLELGLDIVDHGQGLFLNSLVHRLTLTSGASTGTIDPTAHLDSSPVVTRTFVDS